jgi:hypothetical protein
MRLWDIKTKNDSSANKLFKSHNSWISDVKPLKNNENIFASVKKQIYQTL